MEDEGFHRSSFLGLGEARRMELANGAARVSASEVGPELGEELREMFVASEVLPAPGDRTVVIDPERFTCRPDTA